MPRESSGSGFIYGQESHYIPLPAGAGQVSSILSLPQLRRFAVTAVKVVTAIAGTGAGATRTFNVRKGSATGTVVATGTVTLASQATVGVVLDIPVTAANGEFIDSNDLTIEWPTAGAVAFTAGAILVVLTTRQKTQQRN